MKKTMFLFFFIFIFFTKGVLGEVTNAEYYFVVQENGNTIVGINLYGSGEITIPLPDDVESVYVKGGLYMKDNESMTIAIGSLESAAVIYQTALLTKKMNEEWIFSTTLENQTNKSIMAALPLNTVIKESSPSAFIEIGDFTKLYWNDINSLNSISFNYSFPTIIDPIPNDISTNADSSDNSDIKNDEVKFTTNKTEAEHPINVTNIIDIKPENKEDKVMLVISNKKIKSSFNAYWIILFVFSVSLLSYLIYIFKLKSKKKSGRQQQVLQTLTENEAGIINLLLSERKFLKRSFIEKKLQFAKSSLAATLNNLERKKIIELDRTYNSHKIKLADWFIKL